MVGSSCQSIDGSMLLWQLPEHCWWGGLREDLTNQITLNFPRISSLDWAKYFWIPRSWWVHSAYECAKHPYWQISASLHQQEVSSQIPWTSQKLCVRVQLGKRGRKELNVHLNQVIRGGENNFLHLLPLLGMALFRELEDASWNC